MSTKAALFAGVLFLAGCASQKQASAPLNFSGHMPIAFGEDAEKIWQEQLDKAGGGIRNYAVVRAVRDGEATVSGDSGSTWRGARVGMKLGADSEIHTDPSSTTDLFLGDNGPVIRVTKDSELRIVRLNIYKKSDTEKSTDTMIDLRKGKILGNVKKLSADSSYLIRTQGGVIQIRGTEFEAHADGTLNIISGMGVVHFAGKTYEVKQGEMFIPGPAEQARN